MKKLGVGVRVRKVSYGPHSRHRVTAPIGSEGVIVGTTSKWGDFIWCVRYDGLASGFYDWHVASTEMLEPILDADDERIQEQAREFVKKVTKPEPVMPAVPGKVPA